MSLKPTRPISGYFQNVYRRPNVGRVSGDFKLDHSLGVYNIVISQCRALVFFDSPKCVIRAKLDEVIKATGYAWAERKNRLYRERYSLGGFCFKEINDRNHRSMIVDFYNSHLQSYFFGKSALINVEMAGLENFKRLQQWPLNGGSKFIGTNFLASGLGEYLKGYLLRVKPPVVVLGQSSPQNDQSSTDADLASVAHPRAKLFIYCYANQGVAGDNYPLLISYDGDRRKPKRARRKKHTKEQCFGRCHTEDGFVLDKVDKFMHWKISPPQKNKLIYNIARLQKQNNARVFALWAKRSIHEASLKVNKADGIQLLTMMPYCAESARVFDARDHTEADFPRNCRAAFECLFYFLRGNKCGFSKFCWHLRGEQKLSEFSASSLLKGIANSHQLISGEYLPSRYQFGAWIGVLSGRVTKIRRQYIQWQQTSTRIESQWAKYLNFYFSPWPTTHFKLLLGCLGLRVHFIPDLMGVASIDRQNNESEGTKQHSATIKKHLIPWDFVMAALAGGFGVLWGMWTLSRERKIIVGTIAFLGGLAIWAYAGFELLMWGSNR
jgi:hypothetical protein